jgi:hypothetical protein
VTKADGNLVVALQHGTLPEDVRGRIDQRSLPPGKRSAASGAKSAAPPAGDRPAPETMAEVARSWPKLGSGSEQQSPPTAQSEVTAFALLSGADKANLKESEARFVFNFEETYPQTDATASRVSATTLVVKDLGKDRMSGRFLQAISVAPSMPGESNFPVAWAPITLEGDFVAHRVPDTGGGAAAGSTTGGFFSRFLEMFSGCGG